MYCCGSWAYRWSGGTFKQKEEITEKSAGGNIRCCWVTNYAKTRWFKTIVSYYFSWLCKVNLSMLSLVDSFASLRWVHCSWLAAWLCSMYLWLSSSYDQQIASICSYDERRDVGEKLGMCKASWGLGLEQRHCNFFLLAKQVTLVVEINFTSLGGIWNSHNKVRIRINHAINLPQELGVSLVISVKCKLSSILLD